MFKVCSETKGFLNFVFRISLQTAVPGDAPVRVADRKSGLYVVAEHAEGELVSLILDGKCLQQHPAAHQIPPGEDRGRPVEHVFPGHADAGGGPVLEGQHALDVEMAGAGDQVPLVRIFPGELPGDQVAAVILS